MNYQTITSKNRFMKSMQTAMFVFIFIMMAISGFGGLATQVDAHDENIKICHATSSPVNSWVEIVVNHEAENGHMNSNGNHDHDVVVGENDSCPNVAPTLGSITICKAIIDENDNLVDGNEVDATFSITDIDAGDQIGLLGITTFSTPLNFNYDIFGNDNVNDAECVTHNDLTIGLYNYTEETITPSGDWKAPLYNDQFSTQVIDLDDFFSYAYYTNANGTNADGRIILTENRPNRTLVMLNEYEAPVVDETITISATKIVCNDEASLPNWGASTPNFQITANTATDFLAQNSDCHLEDGWEFEWADSGTPNPGDNTGVTGGAWTMFGPTVNGVIETVISKVDFSVISKIWVREAMQALYVPFTGVGITEDVTAEMYCNSDVYNYDNFDYINSMVNGETYYCVAFNALSPVVVSNTKPVITVQGDQPQTIILNDAYTELNATVADLEDDLNNLPITIIIDATNVNTAVLGTYEVTYNAQDSEGLDADEKKRVVNVISPTPKPECSDGVNNNDGDDLVDTLDPGCHTDGDETNQSSYDPNDDDEWNTPPYANYCGDGIQNQTWEQCDAGLGGDNQCTAQCQISNQCVEAAFARVNVSEVQNWGNGDQTSDIFLGSSANKIPAGAWFPLYYDSAYFVDADMTSAGYEDVPGIAVERLAGEVRLLTYGSHPHDGSKEFVTGNIEFYGVTTTAQRSDNSGNNKLENGFNNVKDKMPGQDEVWFENSNDTQSFFWLTTTTADDGYFTEYGPTTICVIPNEKPVITLVDSTPLYVALNGTYNEPGATATDDKDDDVVLTAAIQITGDNVTTNTIGSYFKYYDVQDSGGLDADTVTREVIVYDDSVPAQCEDDKDNDGDNLIDELDPGCWTDPEDPNTYDPNDDDENTKPVITRVGDEIIYVVVNTSYTDQGATVADTEDDISNLPITIQTVNPVNVSIIGTYTVTYNAEDSEGLDADEVTRTVEVVESEVPNEKPVITLKGEPSLTIEVGNTYSDKGATADDPEDGDITVDIQTVNPVDTGAEGTYTITYNVTDSNGAAADEVTRTVTVVTPSTPVCTSSCGGGGGGPVDNSLRIFNEKLSILSPGVVAFTWETNRPSDSRVVYDTDSHVVNVNPLYPLAGEQNLSYAFVTNTDETLVKEHSVVITNVDLHSLFFFRPISEDNTRAIGVELQAVLGEGCSQYLFGFIQQGADNDTEEVSKLQIFLRDFEGFTDLEVTGVYDQATYDAVVAFQIRYEDDILSPWGLDSDTGFVYLTTRKKINEIYCNFELAFPLSGDQLSEVNSFKALLESLEGTGQPLPDTSRVGVAPTTEEAPTFAFAEDLPTIELIPEVIGSEEEEGEEGNDTLASAIEATEGGFVQGVFSKIGNFVKGFFR